MNVNGGVITMSRVTCASQILVCSHFLRYSYIPATMFLLDEHFFLAGL